MPITSLTQVLIAPFYSKRPVLSADGRSLVVYVEGSSYFSGGSQYTDGLVLLDLEDGSVVPLSTNAAGLAADPHPEFMWMNKDASQVMFTAFTNSASGEREWFVTNTVTGKTELAVAYPGAGANASFGTISANGRYMVVQSKQVEGQYFAGLHLLDRQTGTERPVASLTNTLREGMPTSIDVTEDGRKVLYQTYASNVVPGDTNNSGDYFVEDMLTGKAVAVQSSTGGEIGNNFIFNAVMSANGRYVAFNSMSTNLVADGASHPHAAYVKDLLTGAIVRVSEDAAGTPASFGATVSSISADGRYVTLVAHDDMDIPGAATYGLNLFVKDLQTGGLGLVNASPAVVTTTMESSQISANGEMVTYMGVKMENEPTYHAVFHVFVAPRPAFTTVAVDSRLSGGAGADTLAGALGHDTYDVNHAGDIVLEYAGQGIDTVVTSLNNYTLPDNVEYLRLAGTASNGNGNALDNLLGGTAGSNVLRGGAGDDVLEGGGGADTLHGDAGYDVVRFPGSVSEYALTKTTWRHEVARTGSDAAVSYMTGVEHLVFADADVTLETDGTAAMAYRLYQAAFDRKPDLEGLGYWISRMTSGTSIDEVARNFVDSLEFKQVFGANPTNAKLVEGMYRHVLHRDPEPAGISFWVDVLDRGAVTTAEVLKSFSESPENQAALIGVIGHGIAYVPYGG